MLESRARPGPRSLLAGEGAELGVEARDAAATVQQLLVAAGPGRVRLRIDIQVQGCDFLPVGGARAVGGAIDHHHIDEVVAKIDLPKLIEELQKEENEGDDGNILTHVANLVYLNILVKNFKNNQISLQISQQEGAQKKFREYLERHLKRMCEYYEYEREIDE